MSQENLDKSLPDVGGAEQGTSIEMPEQNGVVPCPVTSLLYVGCTETSQ